jgi:hypothetical protein
LNQPRPALTFLATILLIILVIAGSTWANLRYTATHPGGMNFLTYWVGARSLLTDGESPYSDPVQGQILATVAGWDGGEVYPQLRPTYPLYAMIFFLPFASINDYNLGRLFWMGFLEAALIIFAILNLRLTKWQASLGLMLLYFLFTFSWLHSLLPLMEGSAIILVGLLVTSFFLALRSGHDELAGMALAFATILPTAVILLIGYVVVWAFFQRRWVLLVWTLGSFGLLTAGGMLVIPDWPLQWIRTLLESPDPLVGYSTGAVLAGWWPGLGVRLGWVLTGVLGLVLLTEWWLAARRESFKAFTWTACLTLAASPLLGLPTSPVNHILHFIPLVFIWSVWAERMEKSGRWVILTTMALVLALPWVIFLNKSATEAESLPLARLLFPLPLLLMAGLYWIRWWAVRPVRTVMDELRLRGEL